MKLVKKEPPTAVKSKQNKIIPEENNIFIREKVANMLKLQKNACIKPKTPAYDKEYPLFHEITSLYDSRGYDVSIQLKKYRKGIAARIS